MIHPRFLLWLLLPLVLSAFAGCAATPSEYQAKPDLLLADSLRFHLPYDLLSPSEAYLLPPELEEVSALSWGGENQLVMVEDEHAVVYRFDLNEKQVAGKHDFGKNGDYEGIELVGDTLYVLKSNGKIYEIPGYPDQWGETLSFETELTEEDDTEGLGFDPLSRKLLISPKEPRRKGEEWIKSQRAIYGFDLRNREMSPEPIMLIEMDQLQAFIQTYHPKTSWGADFEPSKKGSFKPSGIAVHPLTGHWYVIASAGQLLIVLDPAHGIVEVQPLPRGRFSQPEGICFSPEGDLFISNEARDDLARVLRFTYQTP